MAELNEVDGRPAEFVLADLAENVAEVARINARLEELRAERHELCRQAVAVGAVLGAASILREDSWRVLQMRDMAVQRAARRPGRGAAQ